MNGDEEESCDPKNHEDFSAAKTLLKRSDIAADEEEEDDEDNWESLIDNGVNFGLTQIFSTDIHVFPI